MTAIGVGGMFGVLGDGDRVALRGHPVDQGAPDMPTSRADTAPRPTSPATVRGGTPDRPVSVTAPATMTKKNAPGGGRRSALVRYTSTVAKADAKATAPSNGHRDPVSAMAEYTQCPTDEPRNAPVTSTNPAAAMTLARARYPWPSP